MLDSDLVVFGNPDSQNFKIFKDAIIKAFSDGVSSWLEFRQFNDTKIREFKHPLEAFHEILEIQKKEHLYLVPVLSYEFGSMFENIPTPLFSDYEFPVYSILGFIDECQGQDRTDLLNNLSSNNGINKDDRDFELSSLAQFSAWRKVEYEESVKKIKNLIKDGETYQINLSQNFKLPFHSSPFYFFKNLLKYHKAPYSCLINLYSKKFWYFGNIIYFCSPNQLGDIFAVVVKWYTRYFEGGVGASPCEFDSHLPHD